MLKRWSTYPSTSSRIAISEVPPEFVVDADDDSEDLTFIDDDEDDNEDNNVDDKFVRFIDRSHEKCKPALAIIARSRSFVLISRGAGNETLPTSAMFMIAHRRWQTLMQLPMHKNLPQSTSVPVRAVVIAALHYKNTSPYADTQTPQQRVKDILKYAAERKK